jgi:hypothetical protein
LQLRQIVTPSHGVHPDQPLFGFSVDATGVGGSRGCFGIMVKLKPKKICYRVSGDTRGSFLPSFIRADHLPGFHLPDISDTPDISPPLSDLSAKFGGNLPDRQDI